MADGDGHTPDSCPGLSECKESIRAQRAICITQREWLTQRFGDMRHEIEVGFAGLHAGLDDLRKATASGDRDIVEARRADGRSYEERWTRVFNRIEKLERHAAMQWVLVVLLGMMAIGRGGLWLYGLIAGGGP